MRIAKSTLTFGLVALLMFGGAAEAKYKIDKAAIAKLEKVAIVSMSFKRFNDPKNELQWDDPEYVMMHGAGDDILEIISAGGSFEVMAPEDVVANEKYESLTDDYGKIHSYNNYYPHGYRRIKLAKSKKEAIALCAALGVDAVVQVYFSEYGKSTSSGSVFGPSKTNNSSVLTGEVTMMDKNGKILISGKSKAGAVSTGSSIGKGSISIKTSERPTDFHTRRLDSFLGHLRQDLGLH
jgi:hypothetical protein